MRKIKISEEAKTLFFWVIVLACLAAWAVDQFNEKNEVSYDRVP